MSKPHRSDLTPPLAVLVIQTGHESARKLCGWKFTSHDRELAHPPGEDFDIVARWCESHLYQRRGALVNDAHPACLWIAPGQDVARAAQRCAEIARVSIDPCSCSYFTGEKRIATTSTRSSIRRRRISALVNDSMTDVAFAKLPSWDWGRERRA